jgi:phage regulator Rha-like protein
LSFIGTRYNITLFLERLKKMAYQQTSEQANQKPTNQSMSQSINIQQTYHPANQSISQTINRPVKESVFIPSRNQLANH